jgi:hypothetical protein
MQVPTNGGSAPVAYFSEALEDNTVLRLPAAVVCRGVPTLAARSGGGGPLGSLRGIRHRLWLRLGPLGIDASVAVARCSAAMSGRRATSPAWS